MCHQNELRCWKCLLDFSWCDVKLQYTSAFFMFLCLGKICRCFSNSCRFSYILYVCSFRGRILMISAGTCGGCGGWHFVDNINTICNCSVWSIIAALGNFVYVGRTMTVAGRVEYPRHFYEIEEFVYRWVLDSVE